MNLSLKPQSCDPIQLIDILSRSSRATEAQLDSRLEQVGLSIAQWKLLRQLVDAGGQLPLHQLAARLNCVKSNITQLADRLEAGALLRRAPHPSDRRSIQAEITATGEAAYEAGREIVQELETELFGVYTAEEIALVKNFLARLVEGNGIPNS